MKNSVTLELGQFAAETLAGDDESGMEHVPPRIVRALRYYLHDSGSDRAEWPYPDFLPGKATGESVKLELEVDDSLWASFEKETQRQGVSAQQLAEHAVLYYAADRDAGRVTQRILDDLDAE